MAPVAIFLREDASWLLDSAEVLEPAFSDDAVGIEATVDAAAFHLSRARIVDPGTVVIHVRLPAERPSMASLTAVFGGANWHERECAEMFGITFDGHPNLVKLYLPEDFEGYPLRRSFKLASRTYKAWPGAKDEEEAAAGGPLR